MTKGAAHYGGRRSSPGRPVKFTPGVFTLIETWVEWGFDRIDIARRIDSTVHSLEQQCSFNRLKLNPPGARPPRGVLAAFKAGSVAFNEPPQTRVPWREEPTAAITVRPARSVAHLIREAAQRRGLEASVLLTRIVEAVVRDKLIDAVLDDAEPSSPPAVKRVDA